MFVPAKPGSDPRIHIQPLKSTRAGPFGAKGHICGTQSNQPIGDDTFSTTLNANSSVGIPTSPLRDVLSWPLDGSMYTFVYMHQWGIEQIVNDTFASAKRICTMLFNWRMLSDNYRFNTFSADWRQSCWMPGSTLHNGPYTPPQPEDYQRFIL